MTKIDQIKNYVYISSRPFTCRQIVNELGLDYKIVKTTLRSLNKKGFVINIGLDNLFRKVYVYNKNYREPIKLMRGKIRKVKPPKNTLEYIEMEYWKQMKIHNAKQ